MAFCNTLLVDRKFFYVEQTMVPTCLVNLKVVMFEQLEWALPLSTNTGHGAVPRLSIRNLAVQTPLSSHLTQRRCLLSRLLAHSFRIPSKFSLSIDHV